ncbi:MMPL family transporter [Streptomyces sp. NPDC050759]|uniref:MMPL family transporter n=1 Tax=Streptomyces sp. NPDC050759 TaxID=3365635 RepID=UPI0037B348FD
MGRLPTTSTNRQANDMIADGFGPGFNGPLVLAVQAPTAADKAAEAKLVTALEQVDGVASAAAAPIKEGQTVGVVSVVPATSPQSAATSDLIHHLRVKVIPPAEQGTSMKVYVGGVTASNDDLASVLMGKLPLFVLVIAAIGFLLLTVAFRSLLIPAVGAAAGHRHHRRSRRPLRRSLGGCLPAGPVHHHSRRPRRRQAISPGAF